MIDDADRFRLLVVDDDPGIPGFIREALSGYGDELRIDFAPNPDVASERLRDTLYDLAILDLYRDSDNIQFATEAYRRIDAANLATKVLLATRFEVTEDARLLLQLTCSPNSWRLIGFLDKLNEFSTALNAELSRLISKFHRQRAVIEGLDLVVSNIRKQRHRYKNANGEPNLRSNKVEIAAEVDRLIRQLYVELPADANRTSRVRVDLRPVDSPGLSAAVVTEATVEVHFAGVGRNVGGHRTILKIGPKADILDEAARYAEFVRYGVKLMQRVELQAVAGVDALGGLVYSFAGGLYGNDLMPLDKALTEDIERQELSLSTAVINSLFSSTNWYNISVDPQDVGAYFSRNYKTNLVKSCQDSVQYLLSLLNAPQRPWPRAERVNERNFSYLRVTSTAGTDLRIPDRSVLGWSPLLYKAPGCLVHGDMHGGNVLLEYSLSATDGVDGPIREHHRTCLIDFRNAGPGPRSIDSVCLEASIRLADAEAAQRSHSETSMDSKGSISDELANMMIDRFESEKALYRAVFLHEGQVPDEEWAVLSATVLTGLLKCFEDLSLQEYLATSIRYTIRNLGFRVSDAFRLRLTSWLGAQYALANELDKT